MDENIEIWKAAIGFSKYEVSSFGNVRNKKTLFENCNSYGISGVYAIANKETNERYIGSSKDILKRWYSHTKPSSWKKCPNNPLYKDMQKYGIENFSFTIVALVSEDRLKEVEQSVMNTLNHEYNSIHAHLTDDERKEWRQEYNKSEKGKTSRKKYYKTDKFKAAQKKYLDQICIYEGEELKLGALVNRFCKLEIVHPVKEAKKYLKK